MKKSGLLFSLLFNFSISPLFAQFESPGEIFFSSDDSKVTTAYFTAHIEGLPKYNENSWLIDLRLNAAIPNEVLKKCFWTISGPNTKLHFEDSLNSKLVRISVPFPPTSGFFWQDFKNFFINGSVSIGPANHWLHYESATTEKSEITLNSFADIRLAFGYNSDRFFSGVSFIAQSRNIKFEQLEFTSTNTTFKMVVGYRFKEFGILKYRAWDLLSSGKNKTKKVD